jgi:hypothetical protein
MKLPMSELAEYGEQIRRGKPFGPYAGGNAAVSFDLLGVDLHKDDERHTLVRDAGRTAPWR